MTKTEVLIPSEKHVEMEQEKQASDTAATVQVELIQTAVRERQPQMQLDKMKDDVSQFQTQFEQQLHLREELDDIETWKKVDTTWQYVW